MTAEAWVCRQFLGVGGPGPSSSEAAEFLAAERLGPRQDQRLLLVLRHARALPARRRTVDEVERQDSRQDRRPAIDRRPSDGELGARHAAPTGRRGAASIARPSRPFRSRSITATCGFTTNPRFPWKPEQLPTGGPVAEHSRGFAMHRNRASITTPGGRADYGRSSRRNRPSSRSCARPACRRIYAGCRESTSRQGLFDRGSHGLRPMLGSFSRLEAGDHLTLSVDQELVKVPFDLTGELGIGRRHW